MPNVHLAHHPTLGLHSLHDHVHLHKDVISIFARTLKDVALGRSLNKKATTPPQAARSSPPEPHYIHHSMPRTYHTPQHGRPRNPATRHRHQKPPQFSPQRPTWHQKPPEQLNQRSRPPHQDHLTQPQHQQHQELEHQPTSVLHGNHPIPPASWQQALMQAPHKLEQPRQPSYAAVLSEANRPSKSKLEEIRDLLGIICTHLMD